MCRRGALCRCWCVADLRCSTKPATNGSVWLSYRRCCCREDVRRPDGLLGITHYVCACLSKHDCKCAWQYCINHRHGYRNVQGAGYTLATTGGVCKSNDITLLTLDRRTCTCTSLTTDCTRTLHRHARALHTRDDAQPGNCLILDNAHDYTSLGLRISAAHG